MSNLPIPPTFAEPVIQDEQTKKTFFNPVWIKWFLDFAQILQTLPATTNHEGLAGLLGGTTSEHYHFTNAEHTALVALSARNNEAASTLLGRGSASGAGTPQEISPGSGLSISGTTIAAVAGTNGVGYIAGAGGTITQATNKVTAVTLNKLSGEITMNNAALGAGVAVAFAMLNSTVGGTDVAIINQVSGGTAAAYEFDPVCSPGAVTITVRNITAGSLSEAIVLRFAIIKAATT